MFARYNSRPVSDMVIDILYLRISRNVPCSRPLPLPSPLPLLSIVFNFSRDDYNTQEKLKTKVI